MMFWAVAFLALLLAVGVTLNPLLGRHSPWRLPAWGALVVLPLLAILMYREVGTPAALDFVAPPPAPGAAAAEQPEMKDLIGQLQSRLQEHPDSVEGWMLLGRSYKTLQQYPEAVTALETADRLQPGDPLIATELVEARLFASGDPRLSAEMVRQLEQAVAVAPDLQKALWLLGIAAAQSGDNATAIRYWENLLQHVEPGSEVARQVTAQIAQAGGAPVTDSDKEAREAAAPVAGEAWPGARLVIEAGGPASRALSPPPAGAVLFVIVRDASVTGGPPLGVRRVAHATLPIELELNDTDSMMPQRPISSAAQLSVQARLSLSGQPTPSPGDWQSAIVPFSPGNPGPITLVLDQEVE